MFLTSTALRYHLVNCTIDTEPWEVQCAPLACARHLSIPKWNSWMRWRISGPKLCGTIIRSPLNISPHNNLFHFCSSSMAWFLRVFYPWFAATHPWQPSSAAEVLDPFVSSFSFWSIWVLKSFQSPRHEFQTHQAHVVFRWVRRLCMEYLLIQNCFLARISHWLRKAWFEGSTFGDGEALDEWVSSRLLMVCGHFLLLQHSVRTRNHGSARSQKLSPASLFLSAHMCIVLLALR